jgi:hypothetical protein
MAVAIGAAGSALAPNDSWRLETSKSGAPHFAGVQPIRGLDQSTLEGLGDFRQSVLGRQIKDRDSDRSAKKKRGSDSALSIVVNNAC